MARAAFPLGFSPAAYNRAGLRSISDKALQHEYARLRRDAQDRLRGFERSATYKNAAAYQENKGLFIPLKAVSNRAQLEQLVIAAARFVTAKGSSVSGAKEIDRARVNSLKAAGYNFVNMKNIRQFGDFMDKARSSALDKQYGSGTVAKMYAYASKRKIPPDQLFARFSEYLDRMEKTERRGSRSE